jgi:hypothetical protein
MFLWRRLFLQQLLHRWLTLPVKLLLLLLLLIKWKKEMMLLIESLMLHWSRNEWQERCSHSIMLQRN